MVFDSIRAFFQAIGIVCCPPEPRQPSHPENANPQREYRTECANYVEELKFQNFVGNKHLLEVRKGKYINEEAGAAQLGEAWHALAQPVAETHPEGHATMELDVDGLLVLAEIITGILDVRQGGAVLEEWQEILCWV